MFRNQLCAVVASFLVSSCFPGGRVQASGKAAGSSHARATEKACKVLELRAARGCQRTRLRKLQVRRGLARLEDGQTDCIRLLFEPRGRFGIRKELGSSENVPDEHMQQRERFYTSAKENRCVVCGSDVHLARYNLVPSCFRSFLPTSHQPGSHDVLLLCVPCHHKAFTEHGQQIKESLAREVNVGVPKASPTRSDPRRRAAICASGLLKGGDNVPWPRAEVVFQRILRAWELGDDLSCLEPEVAADVGLSCYERAFQQKAPMLISRLEGRWPGATKVLWRASNWSEPGRHPGSRCRNQQETEVGRRTVEAWMDSKRDLGDLVCRCRAHFVHIMRPEFLPEHWDVTHRIAACNPCFALAFIMIEPGDVVDTSIDIVFMSSWWLPSQCYLWRIIIDPRTFVLPCWSLPCKSSQSRRCTCMPHRLGRHAVQLPQYPDSAGFFDNFP
eukprot:s2684_g11.t1